MPAHKELHVCSCVALRILSFFPFFLRRKKIHPEIWDARGQEILCTGMTSKLKFWPFSFFFKWFQRKQRSPTHPKITAKQHFLPSQWHKVKAAPPQTRLRPAAAFQTPWLPPCWRGGQDLAAAPEFRVWHSQDTKSPPGPPHCRLSCATWKEGRPEDKRLACFQSIIVQGRGGGRDNYLKSKNITDFPSARLILLKVG